MTDVILIYVTCRSVDQAKKIGQHMLEKRLCACINVFPNMQSVYFWPPKTNQFEEADEAVLILKTLESKYTSVEEEVHKVHTADTPCIFSIPVSHVDEKYYDWIKGELE